MDCQVLKCSNEATVARSLRQSTAEEDPYGLPYEAMLCETHAAQIDSGAEYVWDHGEKIVMGDDLTGLHEYIALDVLSLVNSTRLTNPADQGGNILHLLVRRRGEVEAREMTIVLTEQARQKVLAWLS